MKDARIGLILESGTFEAGMAAVKASALLAPGSYVCVTPPVGSSLLAVVTGVRWAGDVFTEDSASYHLRRLHDLAASVESTFQLTELRFVASVADGKVLSRRPRPFAAGSLVSVVDVEDLANYLDLPERGGLPLGEHSRHPGLEVRVDPRDLMRTHVAVLGQTGSGKTNVLRLLVSGILRTLPDANVVVFDFHDEFATFAREENVLEPPFTFGRGDLTRSVLFELLPSLSIPQQDVLEAALDHNVETLEDLRRRVAKVEASEATRRVLERRLGRLSQSGAFSSTNDLPTRVAHLASRAGEVTLLKMSGIQTELAFVFIARVVRRLVSERMRGRIPPCVLVVDEAHRVMAAQSPPLTTRSFRLVAQEGRKFGVALVAATQRPTLVDPTILSQCGSIVGLRVNSVEDARWLTSAVGGLRPADWGTLGVGQGILARAGSTETLWVDFDLFENAHPQVADAAPARLEQQLFSFGDDP